MLHTGDEGERHLYFHLIVAKRSGFAEVFISGFQCSRPPPDCEFGG